jgi:hypothetical protein
VHQNKEILMKDFLKWKGTGSQLDDVLFIGLQL